MGRPAPETLFPAAAYLVWEAAQTERHEFHDGEVFARAGSEDRHATVAGNLGMALRQHLSGSPCRTYMADMKLNVAAANPYFCRELPSLQEHVLVDLDARTTDCYRKGADGLWVLHPFANAQTVELASVALQIIAEVD